MIRQKYPRLSVGTLCGLFGKTRNAFYDHQRRATAQALREGLVLALVTDIRRELPRLGTRKLHYLLVPRLGEYASQPGRDALFALLAGHGLLIRRRKRRVVTTQTYPILGGTLLGFPQADELVQRAVQAYNELRPHSSCDFLTPSQAHQQEGPLVRRGKNYYQPAAMLASLCPYPRRPGKSYHLSSLAVKSYPDCQRGL